MSDPRGLPPPRLVDRFLELFALSGLAVAQPLYDLLARQPEFLVAHQLGAIDVAALVAALSVVAPFAVALATAAVARVAPRAGRALRAVVLAGLGAAAAGTLLRGLDVSPWPVLVAALAAGAVVAALALRRPAARTFFRLAAALVVVSPLLFLATPRVRWLVVSDLRETLTPTGPEVKKPAPIVLVVLDELPLASLLDGAGGIDGRWFPGFARLAAESTWYRRATTVALGTTDAVPAILTGRYPVEERLPILADHPRNLFTWLAGAYDVVAFEPLTDLCPSDVCDELERRETLTERWSSTGRDLAVVYLHLAVPLRWRYRLTSLDTGWRDFGGAAPERRYWGDVPRLAARFVEELVPVRRPRLYFAHFLVPHLPWKYLPSGREYGPVTADLFPFGVTREGWLDDEWATVLGLQRHLLQLVYTDRLLERILDRMRETGLDDDALLVVVADHGAAFWPGRSRRDADPAGPWEVLRVPLFVKLPGQTAGRVDDADAEVIDLVPTIADAIGGTLPWPVDGVSLLGPSPPMRAERTHVTPDRGAARRLRRWAFEPAGLDAAVARRRRLFGTSGALADLYAIGPHRELVGRRVAELAVPVTGEPARVELAEDAPPSADYVPARVVGRFSGEPGLPLAVVAGGRVVATTWTQAEPSGDGVRFAALVPEDAVGAVAPAYEVWEVVPGAGGAPRLRPTTLAAPPAYRLTTSPAGDAVVGDDGAIWPVDPAAIAGGVRFDSTQLRGWAIARASGAPADTVLVFLDGALLDRLALDAPCPPRARAALGRAPAVCGFDFVVAYGALGIPDPRRLAFVALAGDRAGRLSYEEHFKQ